MDKKALASELIKLAKELVGKEDKLSAADIKKVKAMMKRGLSTSQIAKKLDITKKQILDSVPVDKRSLKRKTL